MQPAPCSLSYSLSLCGGGLQNRGGTRVPATFCATHVAAAMTAKVSSAMTEGSCIEIRLSQTSEPPCRFSEEKENPAPELFNGSPPP